MHRWLSHIARSKGRVYHKEITAAEKGQTRPSTPPTRANAEPVPFATPERMSAYAVRADPNVSRRLHISLSDLNEAERNEMLDSRQQYLASRRSRDSSEHQSGSSGRSRSEAAQPDQWAVRSLLHQNMQKERHWRSPWQRERARAIQAAAAAGQQEGGVSGGEQVEPLAGREGRTSDERRRRDSREPPSSSSSSAVFHQRPVLKPATEETLSWSATAAAPPLPPQSRLAWETRALRIVNRHIAQTGNLYEVM